MADQEQVGDQDLTSIREAIDVHRSAISSKLDTLEGRVRETLETAQDNVNETIDTAKRTVEESVDRVKRVFDLRYHAAEHPFATVGVAAATGFAVGRVLLGARKRPDAASWSVAGDVPGYEGEPPAGAMEETKEKGLNLLHRVRLDFGDELDRLREITVGSVFQALKRVVLPGLSASAAPDVEAIIDGITRKMGGRPMPR